MSQARYALRTTAIADCGAMWSTGGNWTSDTPAVGALMTGAQVDEFAKRHPKAQIVDVIVYRARSAVWMGAFRATIDALGARSTHDERQTARAAGDAAVAAAGFAA